MSHYFRDLHDRELLTLAEQILTEASRRKLVEVILPSDSSSTEAVPMLSDPGCLTSITRKDNRICLLLSKIRSAAGARAL